jgi:hypothetical protein
MWHSSESQRQEIKVHSCKSQRGVDVLTWLVKGRGINSEGASSPRWKASVSFGAVPTADISVPVRHLRVLYALPNPVYHSWVREHTPTGYEFFCPHSSLDSYNNQNMQRFLRQMSIASQFYVKAKKKPS